MAVQSLDYSAQGGVYNTGFLSGWTWYDEEGKRHRDNGLPAVIRDNGEMRWCYHGVTHRIGQPACKKPDGSYFYYHYGKLHNLSGHASYNADKRIRTWWVDGEDYHTLEEFKEACDVYRQKHNLSVPGRLTKRANPDP